MIKSRLTCVFLTNFAMGSRTWPVERAGTIAFPIPLKYLMSCLPLMGLIRLLMSAGILGSPGCSGEGRSTSQLSWVVSSSRNAERALTASGRMMACKSALSGLFLSFVVAE